VNYYPHHIADFNNATRHLTLVERALYRELIDRYYDTEKAIPADDFDGLARRVLARSDEEKAALRSVLSEFFTLEDGAYSHKRCDAEILIYKEKVDNAHRAGKASALARAKRKGSKGSTDVQRTFNKGSTEPQPTNNQEPITKDIRASRKTPLPKDFSISERVNQWAQEKGHHSLQAHFENFVGAARAKGYTYVDWDEALMKAIRDNWAKVPAKQQRQVAM
jgi:uncharacterized protein YdaU (DUF1376 family)